MTTAEIMPLAPSGPAPKGPPSPIERAQPQAGRGVVAWLWNAKVELAVSAAAGVLLLAGVGLEQTIGAQLGKAFVWISLALGMIYGLKAAAEALGAWKVDIDVLMVIGAGLAAGVGHPEEGSLLLFLFVLSGALEDLAMARTRREIEALHKLMPTQAIAWREEEWREATPESLVTGDRIKIRPGDLIPTDAQVAEGRSSVDQSTLTGESLPRSVSVHDVIYAGTLNLDSAIEAVVLRPALESSLHKILNLVTEARQQREPIQRAIDRLSQPYAWSVLLTSAAVLLFWWLFFGVALRDAAYTAITFLIVLSPCALIIATPTVTLTTIGRGARAGVLFKGGRSVESLSRVGSVCLDKTGTLTFGKPSLLGVHPVGWSDAGKLLAVAGALEADSTHPIARAIREAADRAGTEPLVVTDVLHSAGQGIRGSFGGDRVAVGGYAYVEEIIPVCLRARTRELLDGVQRRGQMGAVVAAGGDHGAAGVLAISDRLRPGAKGLVSRLHALGVHPVRMLTGDNAATAEHFARALGLDRWAAWLIREDMVRFVRVMKSVARMGGGRRAAPPGVAFIGDGVNDAPALAAADVAVAVGSIGSDAALESADIVLLNDNLACVPWALRLARRARSILRFNIALAMGVIIVMGMATLVGSRVGFAVPMSVGVAAHEGGTLFVVLNALRLLWSPGVARE